MKNLALLSLLVTLNSNAIEIEYLRKDGKESNFGAHIWGASLKKEDQTSWPNVHRFENTKINIDTISNDSFNLIIHQNGALDLGPIEINPGNEKAYLIQGASRVFYDKEKATQALEKVYDLGSRWVNQNTLAINIENSSDLSFELYSNSEGDIRINGNDVLVAGEKMSGTSVQNLGNFTEDNEDFNKRWEFLRTHGFTKLNLEQALSPESIKDHHVLVIRNNQGEIIQSTGINKAGLLDSYFQYHGDDLGAVVKGDNVSLKLWTPTAKDVKVRVYDNATTDQYEVISLTEDNGVFGTNLSSEYKNKYYLYEITQYHRNSGEVETHLVTDPYSLSLSENSKRSQIVDIEQDYNPENWKTHSTKEYFKQAHPTDMSIYELHTRDFSIFDETVPESERGTFKAFTYNNTNGMKHLRELAKSGLTHIHLLPLNDMASINENKEERIDLTNKMEKLDPDHPHKDKTILEVLESLPKDSEKQQEIITMIKDRDGFNWGYDPHHFMAVEGAYATETNGGKRILEFREAVKNLHENGLKVIVDVVFNHTYDNTVFDKIVPDYYYRQDHFGNATKDSCCFDTASENKMVQKLIKDATVKWVKHYKLDGIRFDLMNFLTKDTLRDIRASLDKLTLEKDGINGKKIYLYGEGWDFGSLKWLLPAESLHQWGAASLKMGLGSFNSTFRDSIKGKGQNEHELFVDDSYLTDKTQNKDQVKLALRGTLNDWDGGIYNEPAETINYLTAHDKATMFDHLMAKTGLWAPMELVARMQQMGIGFISMAQGIPFFHAGVEILRSKSGDENSYNSGDWFNKLDFTYQTNNWAKGLPPAWQEENLHAWPNWRERLQKIAPPSSDQIKSNLEWFKSILKTRMSSPLFRLQTMEQIQQKVSFPGNTTNNDGNHDERLLVMKIDDRHGESVDGENKAAYILFNTSWNEWLHFQDDDLKDQNYVLAKDLVETKETTVKELLDNSGSEHREKAFTDPKDGRISVPCMSLMVYFLK